MMSEEEREIDRIISEFEDSLDLDYFKWIICWYSKFLTLDQLKKCRIENWQSDAGLWDKMNGGGYKQPDIGGVYIAGHIPTDDELNEVSE